MFFGERPVRNCSGAILAHTLSVDGQRLKKGQRLTAGDIQRLTTAGIETAVVAVPDPDDRDEDAAAAALAAVCPGSAVRPGFAGTGRVNLFAGIDGLLVYDRHRLDDVNRIDEAVTMAALPPYTRVAAGEIIATIKIIPLAIPETTLNATIEAAQAPGFSLFRIAAFQTKRAGLIQTTLPGTADKVLDKTRRTLATRLHNLGSTLAKETTVRHTPTEAATALRAMAETDCELILIFGASATTDRRDVIPQAIEQAGGTILHYGMPVDPGNLLLLGTLGDRPVLALPGSARSPKTGGEDWILWRLCADLPVTSETIMTLGAGGLLREIAARPLPREEAAPAHPETAPRAAWRIGILLLAAGCSRRMGGANKLLEDLGGKPLIRRSVDVALAAGTGPVLVVTGHEAAAVQQALDGTPVTFVHNVDYVQGMASSLRAGVAALPTGLDGVFIYLGDMPAISPDTLKRLVQGFDPAGGKTICVPHRNGQSGHPVLFARRFFTDLQECHGDLGAKTILREHPEQIAEIEVTDAGIACDLDTPEAFAAYRQTESKDGDIE